MPRALYNSVMYTLPATGEELELFYIGILAYELGRTPQTIRKWEISGVLPDTMFRDKYNKRLYSQEQIDIIVKSAFEAKIKQGESLANTSFEAKVHRRLDKLKARYLGEEE